MRPSLGDRDPVPRCVEQDGEPFCWPGVGAVARPDATQAASQQRGLSLQLGNAFLESCDASRRRAHTPHGSSPVLVCERDLDNDEDQDLVHAGAR